MNIPEELKEAYEFASNNQRLNVGIYSDQFVRELIERIARLEESRFKQAVYHAEDLLTIADLKRKLAEAKSGWDSCISDLREAEKICRAAENSLTEARKLAEWTPITPENLPKKSNEEFYLALWADSVMSMTNRAHPYDIVSGWYLCVMPHLYTHFRPIAPPQPDKPSTTAKAYGKTRGV
jgi:hypothetical protein